MAKVKPHHLNKAIKIRIYPNPQQETFIKQSCGNSRYIYNHFLGISKQSKYTSYQDQTKELTELKQDVATEWLQRSNAQSLQQTLKQLGVGYKRFFKGTSSYPTFKKRSNGGSFTVPQSFKLDPRKNTLTLPKMGPMKAIYHRSLKSFKVKSVAVTMTPTGKYYASLQGEHYIKEAVIDKTITGKVVGHDLGLKDMLISSDGKSTNLVKPLRAYINSQEQLGKLQSQLAKKSKGSVRYKKLRLRIAKLHEHITNQRKDFIHKLSHTLVSENQANFFETLCVKEMVKTSRMAKPILDAGWLE